MSTQEQTFVIVGARLARAEAAETLREEGFDGRLVLFGNEPERPYERPPLTKDYLRAESPREKAYGMSIRMPSRRSVRVATRRPRLARRGSFPFSRKLRRWGRMPTCRLPTLKP